MSSVVGWEEVEPIAVAAFNIRDHQPEWKWAQEAWEHLAGAGLADVCTQVDRVCAYIRFLVLASFYRDWCALVLHEVHDDSPAVWLSGIAVDPFYVGQLVGFEVQIHDPEWDMDNALLVLMVVERKAVIRALLEGFGGQDGLFLALWKSTRAEQAIDQPENDDVEEPESGADVPNGLTAGKLAGYRWILEGCRSLGPRRFPSKSDHR